MTSEIPHIVYWMVYGFFTTFALAQLCLSIWDSYIITHRYFWTYSLIVSLTRSAYVQSLPNAFWTGFVPVMVLSVNVTSSPQSIHTGETNILDYVEMSVLLFLRWHVFIDILVNGIYVSWKKTASSLNEYSILGKYSFTDTK